MCSAYLLACDVNNAPLSYMGRVIDVFILLYAERIAAHVDIQPRILLPWCQGVDVLIVGLLGSHMCVPERTSSGAKLSS